MGGDEGFGVLGVHDAVADEESAEQQDFGDKKEPHADLGSLELLRHVGE